MCLYLRGENKTVDDHVGVFLFNECDWMVKTRFSVSVKDNSFGTVRSVRFSEETGFTCALLTTLDVMSSGKIT